MKRIKTIIFTILFIGFTYLLYLKVDEFIKIDKCLDKGSKWNYSTEKCECLDKTEIHQNEKPILDKKQ